MASVEDILVKVALRFPSPARPLEGRPLVTHALWICACETMDDAPTWLIHNTVEDGFAWCRVPDGVEPLDLVDARLSAGGHTDPCAVLLWLQGEASEPWSIDGFGDEAVVVQELGRKIRRS